MAQSGGKLVLLQTIEFVNTNEQKTITPTADWANYDFLLFVPDMTVTPQEGQTKNNWLWIKITNTYMGSNYSGNNYSANGSGGIRDMRDALVVVKAWMQDRYSWIGEFLTGRGVAPQCNTNHHEEETFANLVFQYGGYYQGDYGLLNGTLKIYGGKFPVQ